MTAARFVPLLLLGPWGGLITDRSDKRRMMIITQTCLALLSLVLALLSLTGHVSLGALIAVVVALGVVNVFDGPARQSLISNMVGRDRIANAIALNSIAMNTSRIVGPAVGGLLIATVGVTPCFFFNAVSFVAVIGSLVAMRTSELMPSQREVRSKGQIRAGLRYIAGTPALMAPLVMVVVTGTFAWEFPVTLPLLTTQTFHGSAAVYGTIMACLGLGSIAGALAAAKRRRLSVRSLSLSAAIWGLLIAAAAAAPNLAVLYGVIVLVGVRCDHVQLGGQDAAATGKRATDARPGDGDLVDVLAGQHGHRGADRRCHRRFVRCPVRAADRRRGVLGGRSLLPRGPP